MKNRKPIIWRKLSVCFVLN